ncbi:unnamed protein product [Soboliphyme baturini]|uniref:PAX-interacting protein 1 n=1 Tax=Soboliphyme baturini TaxID=241478 RepID=A0A183IY22_9BILA|nr:unnamed protein product [Soboliphyme baturini]
MCFCPSQVDVNTADVLWALITTSGGECERVITERTTHLICPTTSGEKYRFAAVHERIKIVLPEWVFDCAKRNELVDEANYHPKDLLEPLSEEKDSGAAQAIQNLAATLKLEAQQLVERNQQNHYTMNQFSGNFAQAKANTIQEPSSPLVPLDPSRFRELVEKQQVATHQMQQSMMLPMQQQSQASVSQQHPRTMNTVRNSGMESYVVMDSQSMAPQHFQQKVVPQYSPQMQSQQRFWFPSSPQVYTQRTQQQIQVQQQQIQVQQQMVQSQSQPQHSPAYGTLVRMPQTGQVQNQRVTMISTPSQSMSNDGSLSSPSACPSPLGSPNQPMTPQQQQHMFSSAAVAQQQSPGVYCHQVPVQFHQQPMMQQQQQQYASQQQHLPQSKAYQQATSAQPPHHAPHHVQNFRNNSQPRQNIMLSSVPTASRPMQSPSQGQRMVMLPSRYSPSGQNNGSYPSPVGSAQQSQQNKGTAVFAMNSQMQQSQVCAQQQQQQPPPQMQNYEFQQMNSNMSQNSESPHYHGNSSQNNQQNAFLASSMSPSPMAQQRSNSQTVPARYVNVTHGMTTHITAQSQQQPPPQSSYGGAKGLPPPSYGRVTYQPQAQRFTHQSPGCSVQLTQPRQTIRQQSVHRPQKLLQQQQQQQHNSGFESLPQAYRAAPVVQQQKQQQAGGGRGVQTFAIGRGNGSAGVFSAIQQQVTLQEQASDVQKIKFYGHDPNLNVPSDYCLVGCVFLIVDYDRTLDQKEVSEWRIVIAQHGGDVETLYSNKCTHIVCESLRHPVVQQVKLWSS